MSVSGIGSISGTMSITDPSARLHRAQRKHSTDLAARATAAEQQAADRESANRIQQAAAERKAAEAAEQLQNQQVLPMAQTLVQQSRPITASSSALGGSFDVLV